MSRVAVGLVGIGGFGREVMPILRQQYQAELAGGDVQLAFVVEEAAAGPRGLPAMVNGYSVIGMEEFLSFPGERRFNVAIADSRARERISTLCQLRGAKPMAICCQTTKLLDEISCAEGSILCSYSIITSNAKIGRFFHANLHSYVAHDCVIGDYVTFAPHVCCNGNVRIDDHAYIGSNAVIRPGLVIGRGAFVGMGAVVTRDVPPGVTVAGNPARALVKRASA